MNDAPKCWRVGIEKVNGCGVWLAFAYRPGRARWSFGARRYSEGEAVAAALARVTEMSGDSSARLALVLPHDAVNVPVPVPPSRNRKASR